MSEFPPNPSKRELERQQAIAQVISGMVYREEVDYVPENDTPQQLPSGEPGFNWETYMGYVRE